jgi:hypothetical protein
VKDEITEQVRILHDEEFRDFYRSPGGVRLVESRRRMW